MVIKLLQVSPKLSNEQLREESSLLVSEDSLEIEGGNPLCGSIKIDGAKNGVLPLMAASLLTDEPLILTNVPDIADVRHMLRLLAILGVQGEESADEMFDTRTLELRFRGNAESVRTTLQSPESVSEVLELSKKFRAAYFILGPLVGRFGVGILPRTGGGCSLGLRPTNFHVDVMRAFGADVEDCEGFGRIFIPEWRVKRDLATGVREREYTFPKISIGATINAILAAVTKAWNTHLSNCAIEPEVLDLCICLRKMGAKIDVRAREIQVTGVWFLNGVVHRVVPDRIEAGTFMIAAAATKGNVTLTNIEKPYLLVGNLGNLLSRMGFAVTYGENSIQVRYRGNFYGNAPPIAENISEIQTLEYPGFPTDLQSQVMVLLSCWDGIANCRVIENIWEDRFKQVPELQKMGAKIKVVGPREAVIERGKKLHGVTVVASDLRDAAALCIAGLSTVKGEVTLVKNVHHLDRGYTLFEEKLRNCGGRIRRVRNRVKDSRTYSQRTNSIESKSCCRSRFHASLNSGFVPTFNVSRHLLYT